MTSTTNRKETLSDAKRALLAQRLKGQKNGRSAEADAPSPNHKRISPKPVETNNVASYAQERLWFLQQLHPNSAAYNMHGVVRVCGSLDVDALEASINQVIARHQVLRTTFKVDDGQIIQQIHPQLTVTIERHRLIHLPVEKRERHAIADSVVEARRAFDLENGPLIRSSLLKLGEEEYLFRLTLHHIISDEWSTGLLWKEITHFYAANIDDKPAGLAEMPIQYADYAYWQRQQPQDAQLSYWRTQLAPDPTVGKLPVLDLPISKQPPASSTQTGALLSLELSDELGKQLNALSRQHHTTLFNIMLAAFNALLHRYTNQRDLLIGTPIANRNHPDVTDLIGFFINTLVIRSQIAPEKSFIELLAKIRETTLNALANQDIPFEHLVQILHPERDQIQNPLFQVMFVHQTDQTHHVHLPGLTLEQIRIDSRVAKFPLTLFVNESGEHLSIAIEYSTDLFDKSTVERMLRHFETLLSGIVNNPQQPISTLPLLTITEEEQILREWSGINKRSLSAEQSQGKLIHQLFEESVKRDPHAPALAFANEILTYAQLNEAADSLAIQLCNLGILPDTFVAICTERSMEMIVAILGVLKAGGAYVPLDPSYPRERLHYMLSDTAAQVILTQREFVDTLPDSSATILLYVPESREWVIADGNGIPHEHSRGTQPPPLDKRKLPDAEQLAYIIYTSGSTGRPKGVMITHANLVHSTSIRFDAYPKPAKRFLLLSSFAFDSSIAGIFWTLCQGGMLVLPRQGEEKEIHVLARYIERYQVTHLLALPSLYRLLLDYAQPDSLNSLNTAIVAGETCPAELVSHHYHTLPEAKLYNEYGPTEGTVWSTFCQLTTDENYESSVSIGRPVPQMQAYILDPYGNPLPIGIPGELFIAGTGISLGYLNRPALTAERFQPLPISEPATTYPAPQSYSTGDLVKWRTDGSIDFLGRIDQQIKVRGMRIEPGEIEAALLANNGAENAAVHVAKHGDLAGLLVAFIVAKVPVGNAHFDESVQRDVLREQLPASMIPSRIWAVDELPQTPNGKVDRNRLDALYDKVASSAMPSRQPSRCLDHDELEIQLTTIWESVLEVRPINVQDNYFDLGGHSLQAVHLFEQIRKRLNKDMPLASLFQAPTILQQAALLRQDGWSPDWSVLVPIQPYGSQPPLFCAHAVGGNVLSLHALAQKLGSDRPFYAFQSQGLDGKEIVPRHVEEMAAYYITEMRSVQPSGPYRIAGQSSGGLVAFEMARQLEEAGEEVAILGLIDTYVPSAVLSEISQPKTKLNHTNHLNSQQTARRSSSVPLMQRLRYHMNGIRQSGLQYLTNSAKSRALRIRLGTRRSMENRFVQAVQRYCERNGRPLPPRLRPIYVRTAVEQAILNYRPSCYHGDIVLFRATETIAAYLSNVYGSQDGWSQITDGQVTIVDIEGGHNLEQEPAVTKLAEEIAKRL